MAQVPCPDCGQILNVPDEHLNKSGVCRHCNGHIVLRRPLLVAAIDLETTGLECDHDEIIEFAGVLFDFASGQVVDRFSELACPNVPISRKASEVNGITKAMVKDCRKPEEVLRSFCGWLGRAEFIIAHNAPFEASFILATARRSGVMLEGIRYVDTLAWARIMFPNAPDHKLGTLMAITEASTVGLHRASADSEGVRHIALQMLRGAKDPVWELGRRSEETHACAARLRSREQPVVAIDRNFMSYATHYSLAAVNGALFTVKVIFDIFFSKPPTWRDDPMTQRQRDYLYALGMEDHQIRDFTKGQASDAISRLTGESPRGGDAETAKELKKLRKQQRNAASNQSCCLGCIIILLILFATGLLGPILAILGIGGAIAAN